MVWGSGVYVRVQGSGLERCLSSEAGPYLRRIDSCITQLEAQGPSRACDESEEEDLPPTIATFITLRRRANVEQVSQSSPDSGRGLSHFRVRGWDGAFSVRRLILLRRRRRLRPSTASCFMLQGPGSRVQGSGCRFQGAGFRVQGPGFRVQGSGIRVQGPGFRVWGLEFGV